MDWIEEAAREFYGSPGFSDRMADIIRRHHAACAAEKVELERKGKDLCEKYGNALMQIHDLEVDNAKLREAFHHQSMHQGFIEDCSHPLCNPARAALRGQNER